MLQFPTCFSFRLLCVIALATAALHAPLLSAVADDGPVARVRPYAENPRYLAMDGVPFFAIGATHRHSWTPISRPAQFELLQDLDRLAAAMARIDSPHVRGFVRCLPYDPMNHMHDGPVDPLLQPWKRLDDGRYDLTEFEPAWEQRLRTFLDAARQRGILVSLELWDDWSVTRGIGGAWDPGPGHGWHSHPFNPDNNVNYDRQVLPHTTRACVSPFYETLPAANRDPSVVLGFQQRYVDHLVKLAGNYPNVLWNLSNETRAPLVWSRYWAEYLRQHLPAGTMIGEMPSTNRRDGGGECDPDLNPLTLATDDRYDFVDIAQAVSSHGFGRDPARQGIGGAERIRQYQQAMAEVGKMKPLVVSKDYLSIPAGGTAVLWSRMTGGAATSRFHRPYGKRPAADTDFQYEALERMGRFLAGVPFWHFQPQADLVAGLPQASPGANAIGRAGREYLVQLFGGQGGQVTLQIAPGRWRVVLYEPKTDTYLGPGGQAGQRIEVGDDPLVVNVPDYDETAILHLRRL
ncbi:MAG: hypothetical protein EA424_06385 [Planctomycetaceae bacterium]|nr:MAG: hypothetical protein EA424_06385 [Planctomycetaceae bacterium]